MTTDTVAEIVAQTVQEAGAHLVDIHRKRESGVDIIEVLADTDTGITVNQCADISRAISAAFGAQGVAQEATLIVSSPGLDRPLAHLWQYRRHSGRTVEVTLGTGDAARRLRGTIAAVEEDMIRLTVQGEDVIVRFAEISRGMMVVSFT